MTKANFGQDIFNNKWTLGNKQKGNVQNSLWSSTKPFHKKDWKNAISAFSECKIVIQMRDSEFQSA